MTSGKVSIKYINNWNVLRQESYFLEKKNFARWTIIGKKRNFISVRKKHFSELNTKECSERIWKLKIVKSVSMASHREGESVRMRDSTVNLNEG